MKVVITGAAGGIGRATAEAFASDGSERAAIFLIDRDEQHLAAAVKSLDKYDADIFPHVCDLGKTSDCASAIEKARDVMGGIDTLVSNAGVNNVGPLHELSEEDFQLCMDVNLRATWMLAKSAYPALKESRGSLIAVASVAGMLPIAYLGAYPASKAALIMMISQMAFEWGADGIRCNTISPGPIHTDMNSDTFKGREDPNKRAQRLALKRNGTPEEMAAVIKFLASDAASYITGANIAADGGMRSSAMPALRGWDERS